MKRLTSIFLVLAMLLTLVPMNIFAAETDKSVFSDMKDTDYYAQAATALEQLDILAGYPDGTFGAEKSITRAEMAAIVCRMIDKEADAEKAKGETAFDDVNSDHWASGYINIASKESIINGDGNGKFRPEDDVKHEEAIKMVVCALGYGDDVEIDAKDWSKGYLEVADEKGISAALKGTKGKASTRGDVAVMSFNGLSVDLAAPTTSLESGSYRGTKSVKLSTTTKGAEIYYTTNGSTPTVKSTKYTKAISISNTCTLKAITVKDGVLVSDVLSVDYTIKRSSGGGGSSRPSTPSTYTVSFDLNYEGATGAPASQTVNSGDKAFEPTAPERTGYVFVGWYVDNIFTELFDFTNTTITTDTTIYARWVDITDTTDTDGDGLTDPLEDFYGTDKTKPDTDDDELSDFLEINVLSLNALSNDSDNDGILDGDEDTDEDEIINKTEITNGTDPASKDTDVDGLTDKEEETYNTNPLNADTDDDGVSDGKEIELGTDPLEAQATFSMNLSADNDGEGATASVQMELSGEQVETLSIDPVNDETFFPETMPGYMGQAYDFNVEGEFDSADISFEFDASELGPDADPVIYYFNEETQELEELPTTINGNIATATVSHFSKYILVDRKIYQESFTWQDVWDANQTYTSAEIILVIDDSGSLGGDYGHNEETGIFYDGNDPEHKRLEVARDFIENANNSFKVGIVKFDGRVDKFTSELIECNNDGKEALKEMLKITYVDDYADYNLEGVFDSRGYTYMYTGIDEAFDLFSNEGESSVLKAMIVFTDGEAHDEYLHNEMISKAYDNNTKIYTVGLGTNLDYYAENNLKPLAVNTGAAFYLASDASQLADIYDDISEKIDIETDSDNDGIADYYEDNMIVFSGVKLTLDKNNPDTDGDGLLDGEEIELKYEYNQDRTKVKVTGKVIHGNPLLSDTDGDGSNDKNDTEPLVWNVSERDLAILSQAIYSRDIPIGVAFKDMDAEIINAIDKNFHDTATIKELGDWKLLHYYQSTTNLAEDKKYGGYCYGVFGDATNTVLVFRGSVGNRKESIADKKGDWYRNFFVYPFKNDLDGESAEFTGNLIAKSKFVTNKNFYVTGHSRGGMLAQRAGVGLVDNDKDDMLEKLVYYNGMGVVFTTMGNEASHMYDSLNSIRSKVVCNRIDGDVVSILGSHVVDKIVYGFEQCAKDNHESFAEHYLCSFTAQIMPERYDEYTK